MFDYKLPDWRLSLATLGLGAAALMAACGGGGGDSASMASTLATPAAVSYSQGAITGFGSVFVGGVRFDDSGAAVLDEDGNAHDRSELKLGMMVQVDAGTVDHAAATALAQRIRFGNEVLGPVGAVDLTASTVIVLGQTVLVTSSTVFDAALAGGLSALTRGSVVEVHGILDNANARIVATRIEPKTGATAYWLRGTIAALDTGLKTFTLGGQLISYASLAPADVPANLANGQIVRVALQTTQQAGAWVATRLRAGARLPDGPRDAHVEGAITVFTSATRFSVNGLAVDATNATFPDGKDGIVLGARVEVSGTVTQGVLVATKVEIQDRRDAGRRPIELHGDIGNLDTTAKTFALRGMTVWFGGTGVVYVGGTQADLANGKKVEVLGVLSSDRTRVEAKIVGIAR